MQREAQYIISINNLQPVEINCCYPASKFDLLVALIALHQVHSKVTLINVSNSSIKCTELPEPYPLKPLHLMYLIITPRVTTLTPVESTNAFHYKSPSVDIPIEIEIDC